MNESTHQISDVFGITRELPMNYVERESVDQKFKDCMTRDRHVIVYGSSKQGKTSLRRSHLKKETPVIQCSNNWDLLQIHSSILKSVGFRIEVSSSKTVSGGVKVTLDFIGFELGGSSDTETKPLEIDPTDVNDVIAALESVNFSSTIVLEDFHYLPTETQKDFSFALKAFHEKTKITFVIIGVWLEENRLIVYNGDLTGRIVAVDADAWSQDELNKVIDAGEYLLNITFDQSFRDKLIKSSNNSVYLVQEVCFKACEMAGLEQTAEENTSVGHSLPVEDLIKSVVNEQNGRYQSFLSQFSQGFQPTELEMYKWILYPIVCSQGADIEFGLTQKDIREKIQQKHRRGQSLNPGNVTQALQSLASLQVKKNIRPIILDYDQTNTRLNVVDKSFLIWLKYQVSEDLLANIGIAESD